MSNTSNNSNSNELHYILDFACKNDLEELITSLFMPPTSINEHDLKKVDYNYLCLTFIRSVVTHLNTELFETVLVIYAQLITIASFEESELKDIYGVLFELMRQSVFHYLRKNPMDFSGAQNASKNLVSISVPLFHTNAGMSIAFDSLKNELEARTEFCVETISLKRYLEKYSLHEFQVRFLRCTEIIKSKITNPKYEPEREVLLKPQRTHSPDLYDDEEDDVCF